MIRTTRGILGSGPLTAQVTVRGSTTPVTPVFDSPDSGFNRRRRKSGDGFVEVTAPDSGGRILQSLRSVDPARHELRFSWGGELAWVGPIVSTDEDGPEFRFDARDVSVWLDSRSYGPQDFGVADVTDIAATIALAAIAKDPSISVNVESHASGVESEAAFRFGMAGDHISSLSGLNWTVSGRTIVFGEPQSGVLQLPEDSFTKGLPISAFFAPNRVHVVGRTKQVATVENIESINSKGLIEDTVVESSIVDLAGLHAVGVAVLAGSSRPYVLGVDGSHTLKPSAGVTMAELMPGRNVVTNADHGRSDRLQGRAVIAGVGVKGSGSVRVKLEAV